MKKLTIFDCDGTLVDSEAIACEVFPRVCGTMGLKMTQEFFVEHFVGVVQPAAHVLEMLSKLPQDAMSSASQQFEAELAAKITAIDGIPELLESLPCAKCVASNSQLSYLHDILERTALSHFFQGQVFSARNLAAPKPAPDVFLHAALTLGFQAADCVVVEDSLAGIQAGKTAGMLVVGFTGGKHFNTKLKELLRAGGADLYATHAKELQEILMQVTA